MGATAAATATAERAERGAALTENSSRHPFWQTSTFYIRSCEWMQEGKNASTADWEDTEHHDRYSKQSGMVE